MVAIGIRRLWLNLAILEPQSDGETVHVRTRTIRWQEKAAPLHSAAGVKDLTAALKELVSEEKLAGARVNVSLNGDFCVTRAVTGSTDRVQRELSVLERRSELYLSLGPGAKSLATSLRSMDARHQHALLAVANGRTLDALLAVAEDVGLDVALVEPSAVALARVLGCIGGDTDTPALIIGISENSIELGISHEGQLLLDYRPGGRLGQQDVAKIVRRHLARLQRFCDRYYGYARGRIERVFLCGPQEAVDRARGGFTPEDQLTVEVFDPAAIDPNWKLADARPDPGLCGVLGACLPALAPEQMPAGPNLLERIRTDDSPLLARRLVRTFWPVAAATLLAFGLFAANFYEQSRCNELMGRLETLDSEASEFWNLRRQISAADAESAQLEAIAQRIDDPPWPRVLSTVAQCMADDVWLERFVVGADGAVRLTGNSYRETAFYEFVRDLESTPELSQVVVEGTRPAMGPLGRMTKFDVQSDLAGKANAEKEGRP